MPPTPRAYNDPILPTPDLVTQARHILDDGDARFQLIDRTTGMAQDLPGPVFAAIQQVLAALATNQAVSVVPTNMELTTNQAADILNVSRGYVIQLVERGILPHRMVGTHRRIPLNAAVAHRNAMVEGMQKGLDDLAEIDRSLPGLGD